jgi:hypothetical protein
MCKPAALLNLPLPQLIQLQQNALLELLRRYPPTWPNNHVYNVTRRLFEATRELHQAIYTLSDHEHPEGEPVEP